MGNCSIQLKRGKSSEDSSKGSSRRTQQPLLKDAPGSPPPTNSGSSSSEGSAILPSALIEAIPPEFRQRVLSAYQTQLLDLSNSALHSLPCGLELLPGLVSLNLSNNFFDHSILPLLVSTSLATLILSNNRLGQLPADLFLSLPVLDTLKMGRNALRDVPQLPPDFPLRLSHLDLHCNHIETIPEHLARYSSVRHLGLSSNTISVLPPSLAGLSLLSVDLSGNEIAHSGLLFSGALVTTLRSLNMADNAVEQIDSALFLCLALTPLDLSCTSPTCLPEPAAASSTHISSLNLSGNQLTQLPPCLSILTLLTDLDLSGNQLASASDACLLPLAEHLTNLKLQGNRIRTVSPHLPQITSLLTLNLANNLLSNEEAASLAGLSYLSDLDISHNAVSDLPPAMVDINFMASLNISHNLFDVCPACLPELTFLKTLSCANNRLSSLPEEFGQLRALVTLDLSHNQLEQLPDSLADLKTLATLNLSFNKLHCLPVDLGRLAALESLFLHNNLLESLPASFSLLTSLTLLNLSCNSFSFVHDYVPSLPTHLLIHKLINQIPSSEMDENSRTAHRSNSVDDGVSTGVSTAKPPPITAHRSNSDVDAQLRAIWPLLQPLAALRQLYIASNSLAGIPPPIFELT